MVAIENMFHSRPCEHLCCCCCCVVMLFFYIEFPKAWVSKGSGMFVASTCRTLFFWQFQLYPALSHYKNSTNVPTVQLQVSYRIVRQVAQTNIFSIKCLCSAYFLKCACQTPAEHVWQVDRVVLWLECKIYIGRYQLNDPNSTNHLICFDWFNC